MSSSSDENQEPTTTNSTPKEEVPETPPKEDEDVKSTGGDETKVVEKVEQAPESPTSTLLDFAPVEFQPTSTTAASTTTDNDAWKNDWDMFLSAATTTESSA
eukprot:CAMPEP_0172473446 /NCGR_PEP_ID=MMETSP1065-20121228/68860_1 /TAXON_ID=265537 /ORGANISM="Amphiprora paludosa, Strain CCMP125" /LENGTH=101 /DNA_ID=CAMNT_0013231621 /DNA_START=61 /DNA_END=366 /DNA_ORIENTATION=+